MTPGRFVRIVPDMTIEELRRWSAEKLCEWRLLQPGPCYCDKEGNAIVSYSSWKPDSDQSPAWQILKVVERMRELGFRYEVDNRYTGENIVSFMNGKGIFKSAKDNNILIAFLRAANAAHAAWKGE